MVLQEVQNLNNREMQLALLNKRLEDIGWSLFLIMIGLLLLVPESKVPEGTWLVGTGLIMVGVNCIRYLKGIKIDLFSTTLGILALAAGLSGLLGLDLPVFAIFLIVIGLSILFKSLTKRTVRTVA